MNRKANTLGGWTLSEENECSAGLRKTLFMRCWSDISCYQVTKLSDKKISLEKRHNLQLWGQTEEQGWVKKAFLCIVCAGSGYAIVCAFWKCASPGHGALSAVAGTTCHWTSPHAELCLQGTIRCNLC